MKKITIERTKCKLMEDTVAPNMNSYHGAPPTPFLVGETPLHDGSQTPMVSGNETPMVDSSETPMDNAGGSWSAGGSAYGGETWAAGSAVYGGSTPGDASYEGSSAYSPGGSAQFSPHSGMSVSSGWQNSPSMSPGGADELGFGEQQWQAKMVFTFSATSSRPDAKCVARSAPDSYSMMEVNLLEREGTGATRGEVLQVHTGELQPQEVKLKGMFVRVMRGEHRGDEREIKVAIENDVLLVGQNTVVHSVRDVAVIWHEDMNGRVW